MTLALAAASVGRQIMRHSHIAAIACRAPVAWRARRHSHLSSHKFSTRIARNPWMSDDSIRRANTIIDMWIERSQRLQHLKEEKERTHREREQQFSHSSSCDGRSSGSLHRRDPRKSDEIIKHIEKLMDLMEKFKLDKHRDSHVTRAPDDGACKRPAGSMASDLFITTYTAGRVASSIRIPNDVIGIGARMMYFLHGQGAGIADVVKRAQDLNMNGIVFEHENLADDFKVVVSVGEANQSTSKGEERNCTPANLRISTFDIASSRLHGVTTVSGNILAISDKIIPEEARNALKAKGVALDEIARFAADPHARGVTILEHLDLKHGHRIIISLQ